MEAPQNEVIPVGAMRDVMWKGELFGKIKLDTLSNKKGLYGLGPLSGLKGEITINDGICYVSRVTSDSTMTVEKTFEVSAPFFVYSNVKAWEEIKLPKSVNNITSLESFVDSVSTHRNRPFPFKLKGSVHQATIHIQNLAEGTKVSSPQEAHQGQQNYVLTQDSLEIIGFFSTEHQGIYTHHDSYLHMHAINDDDTHMGHLDAMDIHDMTLYLPQQ